MNALTLVCSKCGRESRADVNYLCDNCGGILEVRYGFRVDGADGLPRELLKDETQRGLWKYWRFLPVEREENRVSLDEGNTPLRRADRLGKALGLDRLYLKDETREPTGSFKDRPTAVAISKAKEFGATTVITASSGNAGAAAAAYAAAAGLECYTFVPAKAPVSKLTQIRMYGAHIVPISGNYSNSFRMALYAARKYGWLNVTTTHLNPYSVEGDKTISYEMFEQLEHDVPDWIVIPIGAGPLLTGIFRGYRELKSMGLISKLPRMVGAQADGCSPVAKAFREGKSAIDPWGAVTTIASGVSDPLTGYEQDGDYTLRHIIESGGMALSVSDEQIMRMAELLASKEGVYCESTAAVSAAVAQKMSAEGLVHADSSIVCLVTGSGLKDTDLYARHTPLSEPLDATEEAIDAFIRKVDPTIPL